MHVMSTKPDPRPVFLAKQGCLHHYVEGLRPDKVEAQSLDALVEATAARPSYHGGSLPETCFCACPSLALSSVAPSEEVDRPLQVEQRPGKAESPPDPLGSDEPRKTMIVAVSS